LIIGEDCLRGIIDILPDIFSKSFGWPLYLEL
jgi:hypothetical protein